MREIFTSDVTIKKSVQENRYNLTFKEKLALAELLDGIEVSVIELPAMTDVRSGSLFIKSMSGLLKNSTLAVTTDLYEQSISDTWEALKDARSQRLQILAPVSAPRMEYDYHKKPDEMKALVKSAITYAKTLCDDVEFIANDATRADSTFLFEISKLAILAGATQVTYSDTAGTMLPTEMRDFILNLFENVPELKDVRLGISCSNELNLADACALASIKAGANEVKTSVYDVNKVSLAAIAKILFSKSEECDTFVKIRTTELQKVLNKIANIFVEKKDNSPFENGAIGGLATELDSSTFDEETGYDKLMDYIEQTGYALGDADKVKVWEAFKKVVKKKNVGRKELDAIVATEALQAPEEYSLESYIVTTGNTTDVIAHIKLRHNDEVIDGISLGNGPIDAAFLAIEKIIGRHYELDDFQIQAIEEGREALGRTIISLRANGKVYSGSGTDTDIIGSAIKAYINALNKIVYSDNE